jgi:hypothetical protein
VGPGPLDCALSEIAGEEAGLKRSEGIAEILEAPDLAASYRAAAELAGCSQHTGALYVRLWASGRVLTERAVRDRLIDGYLAKVEECVERSHGKVRADVNDDKLLALGFEGFGAVRRMSPGSHVAHRLSDLLLRCSPGGGG